MNIIGNQISFDPLDYDTANNGALVAKQERDKKYRDLKNQGRNVKRFVLRNQLKKYAALGVEDGRVRDVYYIQII